MRKGLQEMALRASNEVEKDARYFKSPGGVTLKGFLAPFSSIDIIMANYLINRRPPRASYSDKGNESLTIPIVYFGLKLAIYTSVINLAYYLISSSSN